ncbi:replication initiation protein [Psychrobacter sp. M9-54-1]|uniref:RepB family plasmid replication initiator protein n=1 Tax=Psychrobacter TaxID=497 RepID=UPI00190B9F5A|nr:RepB family plasmid replication initiator protein [Psychrobacter sp. M9-54-1]MBK3394529.1 replication initiation protein [Psychrobacter sp. M9-54-1]
MSNDLIVMDNAVINAAYELSVNEQRLILSAMAQIPKGEPVDAKHAYCVTRDDFIRLGVHPDTVAREIRSASKDLMKKSLFIDTEIGELEFHWLSEVLRYDKNAGEKLKAKYPNPEDYSKYIQMLRAYNLMDSLMPSDDDNVVVRLVFNERIVPFLSELRKNFTQFNIEDVAGFSSSYSMRLYQAMMQFKSTGYRKIKLVDLRYMLALGDKYKATKDLKVRVIDTAINEINDKSPYTVKYEMLKTGRKFTHLELKFKTKKTSKKEISTERDANTADLFTVEGLTDKQLGRIARNQQFIADYNHLVSSTSPAGQNSQAWEFEMINRLKRDPSQFNKRPIRDYLES